MALSLLSQVKRGEKIRLAGSSGPQSGARRKRAARPVGAQVSKPISARLNLALDKVTERFGHEAISRGFARAEKAAPTTRIK